MGASGRRQKPLVVVECDPAWLRAFEHRGDLGISRREGCRTPLSGPPHDHFYVCPADGAELGRHLLFRDHLRASTAGALLR